MQSMEEKVRIVFVGGSVGWGWSAAGAADNKCQIYLLQTSDLVWLHATVSSFKDPSTGWHRPQIWIRNACLWNLRVSFSSFLALFWDKSTQWDRRPYALAAKMSAPRQGDLTLGCLVLAAQLFSVLENSLLLRRDRDSTQLKASPEAVCKNFRRKPFSDRAYINCVQGGVSKSATAVFYINALNMSKKSQSRSPSDFQEYSGMIQISWKSMNI